MKLKQVWLLFIAIVTLLFGKEYAIDSRYIFVPAITVCGFGILVPVVCMAAGKNLFIAEDRFCMLKMKLFVNV